MPFFDLGSPVDKQPFDHPISRVAEYGAWVELTRQKVTEGVGKVVITDTTKPSQQDIEQLFVEAGLCNYAYIQE